MTSPGRSAMDDCSSKTSARRAAWLLMAAGALTVVNNYLPGSDHLDRVVLNIVGLAAIALGVVVSVLPWDRWSPRATLAVIPVGLGLIGLANLYGGVSAYSYATYFVAVFVWIGLSQPPLTSVVFAPLAAAVYVGPALLDSDAPTAAVSSVAVAIPVCILVGETVARTLAAKRRQAVAVRQAEERFRLSFDNAPIGMALVSPDGTFLRVNRSLCEIVGYSAEELLGQTFQAITHPDDVDDDVSAAHRMLRGEARTYSIEKRYLHAGGEPVWVSLSVSLVRDDDGAPLHFISQIQDITERRMADEAVREQEAAFRLLADNSSDLITRLNPEGRYVYLSPSCRSILGYDPEELVGQARTDIAHPDDISLLERVRQSLLQQPGVVTVSHRARRRDGTFVWLESTNHSIRDPETGEVLEIQTAARDVSARQEAEAQLRASEERLTHQALHDPLTGLPNRALLLDRVAQALARTDRLGGRPALLFLDLDRFKVINDSLGHRTGDEVLCEVAQRLAGTVREGDTVSRLGGDEFVVLCEEAGTSSEVEALAQRLREALTAPIVLGEGEVTVTASVGVALASIGQRSAEDLVRDADTAMYLAKDEGRDRHAVFDQGLRARAVRRLHLERVLRQALDEGRLRLHYQPIVDLRHGDRLAGVEALLRIDDPVHGAVSPEEFIAVAEETGLIVPIGAGVIEEACRQAVRWQEELGDRAPRRMSVNVSARQLSQPGLAAMVGETLAGVGLKASALSLELTEQVLIDAGPTTRRALDELEALGVSLGIDDFGTGYSSLGYLKRFPVNFVKIDRSFVDGLGSDPGDTAIVRAVLSLGRVLGLATVAEGVETAEQAAILRELGCDFAQGYYFGRPQPPEALPELLVNFPAA